MSGLILAVSAHPPDADIAAIGTSLSAFNDADVGPANRMPVVVTVRDEAHRLVAGVSGYTAWGWLYVQWLWVDESQRGNGLAGRMLAAAEAEARGRNCHGAWIDTFNPVALRAYQRAGYVPFGALEDFPPGRTRTFLQKRF